jgi:glycosyltransferase involved in cell wall biosynthesis
MSGEIEVSVIIPCLNEAASVGVVVRRALNAIAAGDLRGEVIVADNGSSDGSQEAAAAAGARVVPVTRKGYGHALMGGIAASHGEFLIMGDADGSYDFGETARFVAKLRAGWDLVQGCRFPSGGGKIEQGAMPFMHLRIGNPLLTGLARLMFGTRLHDVYCGLRGFSRSFYEKANLRCTGMEFATEMIIKAAQLKVRVTEIPITLARDGRGGRPSHLRTFRDGWRTLRLFLLYSPGYLFVVPGTILLLLGLTGSALALAGFQLGPARLDVHTLLVSSLLVLVGAQCCFLAIFAQTFAWVEDLRPSNGFIVNFYRFFNLEKALVVAAAIALVGLALVAKVYLGWRAGGYGRLDYAHTLRMVIPGVTLMALAAQAMMSSFMVSILGLDHK